MNAAQLNGIRELAEVSGLVEHGNFRLEAKINGRWSVVMFNITEARAYDYGYWYREFRVVPMK